jgi:hypothetical protein
MAAGERRDMNAYFEPRGQAVESTGRDKTLVVGVLQGFGGNLVFGNQVEEGPVVGLGGLRHGEESRTSER